MLKHNGCIMSKVDWVRYREGRCEGVYLKKTFYLVFIRHWFGGIMRMWVVCVLGREEGVMEC